MPPPPYVAPFRNQPTRGVAAWRRVTAEHRNCADPQVRNRSPHLARRTATPARAPRRGDREGWPAPATPSSIPSLRRASCKGEAMQRRRAAAAIGVAVLAVIGYSACESDGGSSGDSGGPSVYNNNWNNPDGDSYTGPGDDLNNPDGDSYTGPGDTDNTVP